MAVGYYICQGDKTTCGGEVLEADPCITMFAKNHARDGDGVSCGVTGKTYVIAGGISHMRSNGRLLAGTLDSVRSCPCRATLIHSLTTATYTSREAVAPQATRAAAQPVPLSASPNNLVAPRQSGSTSAPRAPTPSFSELPGLICENIWRGYQQRAEAIVAPGGRLIADPKERNRAINAAYAGLWLEDNRFQWAGLAAFASKQVGCGLLHAADSIDKIQEEHEAGQRMLNSAKRRWNLPGLIFFGKTDKQAQRDYEHARNSNPVPGIDLRRDGEPFSLIQQQLQHVYEMMAMGNTTLFLDVFPLHAFYKERGLWSLETCLPSRKNLYGNDQSPVLWPVGQRKLMFGNNYEEILQAFEAIESGNIAKSVGFLATHEQVNILQPAMYSNTQLVTLLRSNHISYVTGFPSGAAQAIELTLASQCLRVDDGRTIGFGNNPFADLSDINQRMAFVLDAAARFDELLHDNNRYLIEQAIQDIAAGRGVR